MHLQGTVLLLLSISSSWLIPPSTQAGRIPCVLHMDHVPADPKVSVTLARSTGLDQIMSTGIYPQPARTADLYWLMREARHGISPMRETPAAPREYPSSSL